MKITGDIFCECSKVPFSSRVYFVAILFHCCQLFSLSAAPFIVSSPRSLLAIPSTPLHCQQPLLLLAVPFTLISPFHYRKLPQNPNIVTLFLRHHKFVLPDNDKSFVIFQFRYNVTTHTTLQRATPPLFHHHSIQNTTQIISSAIISLKPDLVTFSPSLSILYGYKTVHFASRIL